MTRNCGDSGVGSPVFNITATGLCERLDVVEADEDAPGELFKFLSFSDTLRGTMSDMLGSEVLKNVLSQLLSVLPRGDCSGCNLVVGAVQLETNQLIAAQLIDRALTLSLWYIAYHSNDNRNKTSSSPLPLPAALSLCLLSGSGHQLTFFLGP